MKARLFARNAFDLGLVAEVEIPPFEELPQILLWGSRSFVRAKQAVGDAPPEPNYIEGMAWSVLPPPANPKLDVSVEPIKQSLRAMVYCVEHLDADDTTKRYCRCRERAARLFNDDGPLFKAAHDGLGALKLLSLALAISSGQADEASADPEFLADIQRFSQMEPASFEAGIESAINQLRALLRDSKWERTT